MVTKRLTTRAVAGLSLWAGFGAASHAQIPAVTPETAFKTYSPKQPGVNVTTPTPDQIPNCKVEPIPGPQDPKTPMGYIVRDPAGKPLRSFVSYDGKTFTVIAYYLNGTEAYREVYPPKAEEAYQFRWIGPNGTKWGIDRDRDGKIDEWAVMSPEELSQELLEAVLTRDAKRAEALVVTKANLDAYLGLPPADAQKILDRAANAAKQVGPAADALKAAPGAKWDHLQLGLPQSTPADAFNPKARDDVITHKAGTVLVQDGQNTKFLQTGEMIQVGRAWKLVDGPGPPRPAPAGPGGGGPAIPDVLRDLVNQLDKIDGEAPAQPTREALAAHSAKRVVVLEQIVAKATGDDKDTWTKLLLDSLSAAADGEKLDGKHVFRIKQFKEAFAGKPGPIGAYAGFRYLLIENAIAQAAVPPGQGFEAVQEKWRAGLEAFITAFPTSEEAPEATLRLALAFEHTRGGDDKAKEWYQMLATKYAKHPHAAKAQGAVRRLNSEGKALELAGTALDGKPFNAGALNGKVVVVYYWASWSESFANDVQRLQRLAKDYEGKGLAIVTLSMDADAKVAAAAAETHKIPGVVLHAPDGSPLANQYGVVVVPQVFVVGKDGKVVNRNAQAATVEDDVKKLLP